MGIEISRRATVQGDTKYLDRELIELAKRQGVPPAPRLSEYFSLISVGENPSDREVVALGKLTGKNGLGKISRVVVTPGHQRQGYGRQLINIMEDFARENGILRIKATTETWSASKLFEHCGYKPIAEIPMDIDLAGKDHFEGGPQYEVLFLKELKR